MSVDSSHDGASSQPQVGLTDRWLWILLPPTLALLPFGNAIREGELAGSGPDVISSVWAMWWFQQEWFSGAWGVPSTVFNFPWGGQGAILSPLSALCWSLLDVGFGPAWATTICNWVVLTISMLSLMFLGKQLGLKKLALGAMGLVCVVSRYMVFTLGETGTVGVACLPLIWGLTAYYNNIERQSNALWIVVMLMMGLQGLENPYLAPVLPVFLLPLPACDLGDGDRLNLANESSLSSSASLLKKSLLLLFQIVCELIALDKSKAPFSVSFMHHSACYY